MTKETKMGFEGVLMHGAAGGTPSTVIENCRDVTVSYSPEKGDTSVRGDGSGPGVNSSRIVAISHTLSFQMLNKENDASLTSLLTHAAAGTPIALYAKDRSDGSGPDFDYTLEVSNGQPYKGEQTFDFTAEPTDEAGRDPAVGSNWT